MRKYAFHVSMILLFASSMSMGLAQSRNSGTASVRLPVLTFVLDGAGGLRPVIGIPGAASIGMPVELGFPVIRAAAAANDYILATSNEGAWPVLLQVRGNTINVRPVEAFSSLQDLREEPGCAEDEPWPARRRLPTCRADRGFSPNGITVDRVVLSPSGSAAAFFSASKQRAWAFTNLSQSPVLAGTFDVGGPGGITALAISDDGRTLAAGIADGDAGSLFIQNAGQPSQTIPGVSHAAAIEFLHNSDQAVIADDRVNTIYMLANRQLFSVANADNGISAPIALALSNDNRKIFIANSGSGSVVQIGPDGAIGQSRSCNCAVTGLHVTNTDGVYRLTDFSGGPIALLDASGAAPRITLVPVGASHF